MILRIHHNLKCDGPKSESESKVTLRLIKAARAAVGEGGKLIDPCGTHSPTVFAAERWPVSHINPSRGTGNMVAMTCHNVRLRTTNYGGYR